MWKVMIADEEAIIREGISKLIPWEDLNCELVYAAKSGRDLLDHLYQYRPHIVITDIQMPGVDGLQAVREMKEQNPDISVILLTAYSDFKYAQEAIHYGVRDYVLKTSLLEDIPVAIRNVTAKMEENSIGRISKVERIFLRTLLDESYYFDDMASDFGDIYEKYSRFLSRFRLVVVKQLNERNTSQERKQESFLKLLHSSFEKQNIKAFPMSKREYCVLCSLEDNGGNLRQWCESLLSLGQSFLGVEMIVGISRTYEGIRFVTTAYQEALNLVNGHLTDQGCRIYEASEETVIGISQAAAQQKESADELISQVNQYIDENFQRKFTLQDIACAVHTNRSYLSRIYKERTGENLFDVITARKVEAAKTYILQRKMIYEVAELVGFEDTAYFSKVFKKYTGLSPKDFEREYREG